MNLVRKSNQWVDPFDLLEALDKTFVGRPSALNASFNPRLDLVEEDDAYKARLDVPGIRKEDLSISIENGALAIRGERKVENTKKEKDYHYSERNFGSFARVVQLPSLVDETKVKASYKDGVLEVVIPKSEKAKPRQIQVEG